LSPLFLLFFLFPDVPSSSNRPCSYDLLPWGNIIRPGDFPIPTRLCPSPSLGFLLELVSILNHDGQPLTLLSL